MAQQPGTVAARRASNLSRPTKKPCSPIPFCINLAMNDDLLMEILLRLPAKSLIRFKSVCKKWRSLIFSDYFCHRHTLRRPKLDPLSLILQVGRTAKLKNSRYSIGLKLLDIGRGRKLILRRSALVLSFNDSAMEREVYEVSVKHLGTMDEPKGMLVDLCP